MSGSVNQLLVTDVFIVEVNLLQSLSANRPVPNVIANVYIYSKSSS